MDWRYQGKGRRMGRMSLQAGAGRVVVSVVILALVAAIGAAHGSRHRRAHAPDLRDVITGLCSRDSAGAFRPADVPVYPGSRGFSLPAGEAGDIHVSLAPAPIRAVRSFYEGALTRLGWKGVHPEGANSDDPMWFERNGKQCLVGFSSEGEGGTRVAIVTR